MLSPTRIGFRYFSQLVEPAIGGWSDNSCREDFLGTDERDRIHFRRTWRSARPLKTDFV